MAQNKNDDYEMSEDEKSLIKDRTKRNHKKTEFKDKEKRVKRLPAEMKPRRISGMNLLKEVRAIKDYMEDEEDD